MPRRVYTVRELLAMRDQKAGEGIGQQDRGEPHQPPQRLLLTNGDCGEQHEQRGSTESGEPIRQQLDGQELDRRVETRRAVSPQAGPQEPGASVNEGFQRFYAAVKSPAHIRVTAGGRIVRNTRAGSASPPGRPNQNKTDGEAVRQAFVPYGIDGTQGMVPIPPQYLQPAMYQSGPGSMSLAPFSVAGGMQVGRMLVVPSAPFEMASNGTQDDENQRMDKPAGNQPQNQAEMFAGSGLPASSPYLALSGNPYMPFAIPAPMPHTSAMLGYSAPSMQLFPGTVQAVPLNSFFGPAQFSPGLTPQQTLTHDYGHGFAPGVALPLQAHMAAPTSSIRMSEVTRKQIEHIRGCLKWTEDQLRFNMHQVDVEQMKDKANTLRQHLAAFEHNLKQQLEMESKQHKATGATRSLLPSADSSAISAKSRELTLSSDDKPDAHSNFGSSRRRDRAKAKAIQKEGPGQFNRLPESARRLETAHGATTHKASAPGDDIANKRLVSMLPRTAALAPPFQPQIQAAQSCQGFRSASENHVQPAQTINPPAGPNHGFGMPYLRGFLPIGLDARDANEHDYIYHRELTEDEKQARSMYWGDAAHSHRKGLPKYDGKNFYPPSPEKIVRRADFAMDRVAQKGHNEGDGVRPRIPAIARPMDDAMKQQVQDILVRELIEAGETDRDFLNRLTKSDNVTGGGESSTLRNRIHAPLTASLVNQATSDDEQDPGAPDFHLPPTPAQHPSPASSDEVILFKGRTDMRQSSARNGIWKQLNKNANGTGTALPGAMSSATAHGMLPQYTGSAAASLAPAMSTVSLSDSARHASFSKEPVNGDGSLADMSEQRENKPPGSDLNAKNGNIK